MIMSMSAVDLATPIVATLAFSFSVYAFFSPVVKRILAKWKRQSEKVDSIEKEIPHIAVATIKCRNIYKSIDYMIYHCLDKGFFVLWGVNLLIVMIVSFFVIEVRDVTYAYSIYAMVWTYMLVVIGCFMTMTIFFPLVKYFINKQYTKCLISATTKNNQDFSIDK